VTEKELMKFVIERSNDPVIKNSVLRDAMNKDLGPRTNFDDGGKVDEVIKYYKKYLGMRQGKQRYKVIPFTTFFEEFARENFAEGQLVGNTVDGSRPGYDGDSSFNRNPSGVNQHTDAQRTFEEIKKAIDNAPEKFVKAKDGTLKKVPVTPKDLYGKGKNYPHKIIARSEYNLHKDKLNIEGTGKPVVEDPKKGNIVRYAKNKLQSNPTILAKMAGTDGYHLSHLSLTELDSLKNLGYLPKDINIKQYHSFEKKIVANAKEIYAVQNNKSLPLPEKRAEIAKLQKVDRALRKKFPNYANTKARLKVQANNVELSGLKIGEKLLDPTVAISQTEGTLLKDIKAGSPKEKEILGLSKKSLEARIIESLKKNPKLAKEVQMSLNAGIPIDDILKSPAVKKGMPWIKGDLYFAAVDVLNNWTKGQSFKKGAQKGIETGTFGLVDLAADEKALVDYAERQGVSKKEIDAMRNYLYYMKEKKNNDIFRHRLKFREDNQGDSTQIADYGEQIFSDKDVARANDKVTQSDKKLQEITDKYFETSFVGDEGATVLQNMMEGLTAEEWNKPAGTMFDRGNRLDQGSGTFWDMFNIPFSKPKDTVDYLNPLKEKPKQELMIKHPVYGYKEQIREMQEKGIDPMEDINYSMDYALPKAEGGIMSLKKKKW